MTATDILRLAGELPERETNRLAHALGWPDLYRLREQDRPRYVVGGVRWDKPYRNHYTLGAAHPLDQWAAVEAAGLVRRADINPPQVTFIVTPLGQAVLRARLQAEIASMQMACAEAS